MILLLLVMPIFEKKGSFDTHLRNHKGILFFVKEGLQTTLIYPNNFRTFANNSTSNFIV